jgi:hypothetical protein
LAHEAPHLKDKATFRALGSAIPGGKSVKSRIALAVVLALSGAAIARAETEEGRQACTNDAFQYCQDAFPDHERVFRCLEARKSIISAACRAAMTPSAPVEPPAMNKPVPQTKSATRKTSVGKSTSLHGRRPVAEKHMPQMKTTTGKASPAKRAAKVPPPPGPKPLNLVPH